METVTEVKAESLLALDALNEAELIDGPYPHLFVPNFINAENLRKILQSFPDIKQGGSFPISQVERHGKFADLVAELLGDRLRQVIAKKFAMDLTDKPPMLTVRGYTRKKDGRVHTDSKDKLITVLIYLEEEWPYEEGKLRVLRSNDLNDYEKEVSPMGGNLFIFKVTDNCWHGYPALEATRRSMQLNYVVSDDAANRHLGLHAFTAKLKRFTKIFTPK